MESKNAREVYELDLLEQKMKNLEEQLVAIQRAIDELNMLNNDIGKIKWKNNEEIFAHIGRGIYVKAKLLSEDFLVRIGEKNLIKKSLNETKEIISEQIKKLQELENDISNNLQKMNSDLLDRLNEFEKNNNLV